MKTTIELDEKDIAEIIAEKFNCDTNDVRVFTRTKSVGYGLNESDIEVCAASVELKSKGKMIKC